MTPEERAEAIIGKCGAVPSWGQTGIREHIIDAVREAAAEAKARETEECAVVAEDYEPTEREYEDANELRRSAWDIASEGIARAIRERQT